MVSNFESVDQMTQLSDNNTSGLKAHISAIRKNSIGDFDHFEHQSNMTHELHNNEEIDQIPFKANKYISKCMDSIKEEDVPDDDLLLTNLATQDHLKQQYTKNEYNCHR